ncbi:hypothetical protein [Arachnia propionica]|uniref:Uncharacterized protein n=1 Tax=Arachnia propionica TaxID=1750 RepID=A0A3P1WS33_9ACTN|nr:hypothetical protein [Arachnia propionica]RRD49071.1 hypothetical protein EII35_09800 [Arachnia propionica]
MRGHTLIAPRALTRLASAVAGDALGVDARRVQVNLANASGDLGLEVASPVRVDPLPAHRSSGGETEAPLLERVRTASEVIRHRVATLTGRVVGAVDMRLTGAVITPKARVK